jgi:hypothetical protein
MNGVDALIYDKPLYSQAGVVYPPFWYGILWFILGPLEYIGATDLSFNVFTIGAVKIYLILATILLLFLNPKADRFSLDKDWTIFVLLNPVVFITTILMGQAEAPVALGVVAALHGWRTERWWLVGCGIALGAVMKFYPILMLAPVIVRKHRKLPRILLGALPIFAFTAGLSIGELPSSLNMLEAKTQWVVPLSLLGWADLIGMSDIFGYGIVELQDNIFLLSSLIVVFLSIFAKFEKPELSMIVTLLPAMFFATRTTAYRWVPLILALGYIGYSYSDKIGRISYLYAWVLTGIGLVHQLYIVIGYTLFTETPVLYSPLYDISLNMFSRSSFPYGTLHSWLEVSLMFANIIILIWVWKNFIYREMSIKDIKAKFANLLR